MSLPPLSVVSLSHNRCSKVFELLSTLQQQTYHPFEVIVVDNASTDGTAEMVRREFPEVKIMESASNTGMVAYNLGFEAAQGEYILVMDDDGLPAGNDWVEQVVDRFERNPKLGAVSCTVRMRDTGRLAHDTPQFVPDGSGKEGYPGVSYNGTGAGLRATALRQVGLYPEYFFNWYLELHMCTRLLNSGWDVRHFPELEVWHSRVSGSSRPHFDYYGIRNYYWYVWELYPGKSLLLETLHRMGYYLKSVSQGLTNGALVLRATRDAFGRLGRVLQQRKPISDATLRYLRWVRNHGNWYHIAPELVPFQCKTKASSW